MKLLHAILGAFSRSSLRTLLARSAVCVALACLFAGPAAAQSALDFAVAGMGRAVPLENATSQSEAAPLENAHGHPAMMLVSRRVCHWRHHRRHCRSVVSRRLMRAVAAHESRVGAPLDIRSAPAIVADAMRYIGSRNPTRFKGVAWCKAFVNQIARRHGYYVNASLRAIDTAAMGVRVAGPVPGAFRVTAHHVSIVASVQRGRVLAVSGNGRGHRVSLSHYAAGGARYYMPIRMASIGG